MSSFDCAFQPSLDRHCIVALTGLKFTNWSEVVHLLGPPRTGKSDLEMALAFEAVKAGKSVCFVTLAEISSHRRQAGREGTLGERIWYLALAALLVVDETAYLAAVPGGSSTPVRKIRRPLTPLDQ
ncbi:ATP-binding protein [Ferirhizobium litorale]|uniref:ATP-binding protein n=1 Tax=Ferirhizobium litorale TaxID=2927786 RepID=UPI002892A672|nr:ATP-binding protein [Fererhizobium litorale]